MPGELPLPKLLNAVSYAARTRKIDRIVALDEFDMENVSAIREHLRIPGMGLTRCAISRQIGDARGCTGSGNQRTGICARAES